MKVVKKLWTWYRVLCDEHYTTISGMLVFFLFASILPLLFLVTFAFGRAKGIEPVFDLPLFGWAKDLFILFQDNAEGATTGVGIFFLATSIWSGSGFFYHLKRSGELIYDEKGKRGFRARLSAFLFGLFLVFFLILSAGVLVAVMALLSGASPVFFYPVVYALIFFIGAWTAYFFQRYLAPVKLTFRECFSESMLISLAWLVATVAFSIYFSFGSRRKLYGALTLTVSFLLWLYWMMICLVSGSIVVAHKKKLAGK